MTALQKGRIKKLVSALRSGKYKQGRGQLFKGGEYCCLGVACDLYGKANGVQWEMEGSTAARMLDEDCELPRVVSEWFGFPKVDDGFRVFSNKNPYLTSTVAMVEANDELKWSFKRIATAIEKKYLAPPKNSPSPRRLPVIGRVD